MGKGRRGRVKREEMEKEGDEGRGGPAPLRKFLDPPQNSELQ